MADGLVLLSLNVNGLRSKTKRKAVFNLFKQKKYDIICLQETYITESVKDEWMNEWKGEFIYQAGTSRSCGEIILFSEKVSDISVVASTNRFLAASFKVKNRQSVVINVYAPNNKMDKESFFNQLPDKIKNLNCDDIILCGDFNCVINNEQDNISGENHHKDTVNAFNDLVNSCNLHDVWRTFNPEAKEYTWARKNRTEGIVARRLDYIFASENTTDIITECNIVSVPFSDHRGCWMRIQESDIERGRGYWKFNNSLLQDQDYVKEMNIFLRQYRGEHQAAQLDFDILKVRIKEFTINFSKIKCCQRRNNYLTLYNELNDLDKILSTQPHCLVTLEKRDKTKMKLEVIELEKTRAAQVRSRANWIEYGERNNKFFLALEKIRAKAKIMEQIIDENGHVQNSQKDIHNSQRNFFAELYSKKIEEDGIENKIFDFMQDCEVPRLSEEQRNRCEAPLTENELLIALKEMKNGSAPGSDGITIEFIKMFWNNIKHFMLNSFLEALEKGSLSISQRNAIITLIHKGKDLPRNRLNNWRPISLTNSDYKIFAKCLAIRMKRVVNDIIHPDQVGYLKGRQVSSLLRLIDDAIDQSNIQNKPGVLATIDMYHAFDCVSKEYMLKAFETFGFGPTFVNLVSTLMKDTRSCVNYAGWLSSYFPVESGIRQGCPFSPLAFILALELLAIKIRHSRKVKGLSLLTGTHTDNSELLKVALYADDLTLFLTDETDLRTALDILNGFKYISGLSLNLSKCEAMWIGRNKHRNDTFCGFKWKSKIKILGTYFSNDKNASSIEDNYRERIAKIKRLISTWEKRNLSIMGKIIVVKTFLISQLVYFMQAFIIPDKVLTEINRILFRFVWKKRDNNKKAFEKVKRTVLCNDYKQGGLKMIDIKQLQISFILHWIKRLTTSNTKDKSTLIPRMIFSTHGPNFACFHSNVGSKVFKGLNHINSLFWSTVLRTWLDNNHSVKEAEFNPMLWNNKHFLYGSNVLFFKEWAEKGLISIHDISSQNKLISYNNICDILGHNANRILEYNVIHAVVNRYLTNNDITRGKIKNLNNTPIFNNKKCNLAKDFRESMLSSTKNQPCSFNFWKRKFNYEITESDWQKSFNSTKETRLRVLQWKLLHNIYPTNIMLSKMRVTNTNFCSYCTETKDYIEHFFYLCPIIRKFWKDTELYILGKIGVQLQLHIEDVLFGIQSQHAPLEKIHEKEANHIVLIGKMCISIFKKTKSRIPISVIFEKQCALRNMN